MKFWWENGIVDLEKLKKSKNLEEFHHNITIKLLGFNDIEEFCEHFKVNTS